jgi:hypothetical protein
MRSPGRSASSPTALPRCELHMSRTYVQVIVVEAAVILLLVLIGRVFS